MGGGEKHGEVETDRHDRKLGGGGGRNMERWRQTDMTGNGGGGRETWRGVDRQT